MYKRLTVAIPALLILILSSTAAGFQGKKEDEDKLRMVHGVVTDAQEQLVDGAVVQLKNTKTLQVRSFITTDKGNYYFHGLDPNVDYTLKAEFRDMASSVRTLSSFDSRKKPVINLKMDQKK